MSILFKSYHYQSGKFNAEQLGDHSLIVFLKNDVLVATIISKDSQVVSISEYRSQVPVDPSELFDLALKEEQLLSASYGKVKVIPGAFEFSLIPAKVFNRDHSKELARILISEDEDGRHVGFSELLGGDAVAVYTFPDALKKKIEDHFGKVEFMPFCRSAVGMALAHNGSNKNSLHVSVFDGQFILTGIKEGKLHICNAYPYSGPTDIVYFLNLVVEILGLEEKAVDIFISGEFEQNSQLLTQLKKHVPHIQIPGDLKSAFEQGPKAPPAWKYAFMTY